MKVYPVGSQSVLLLIFCSNCFTLSLTLSFLLCRCNVFHGVNNVFTKSSTSIFVATGACTHLLSLEDFEVDLPAFSRSLENLVAIFFKPPSTKLISFGDKFCLLLTEKCSANLNFPSRSAFQQHSREVMSRDEVWTIIFAFESRDMLLDRHSEGNHLPGSLFSVVFGHQPVRISKPDVVAVSVLVTFC
jgi:hypothetical protein